MKDEDKKLLDQVVQKHAPWINKSIKHLRATGKIGSQFEDDDFHNVGYNAIVEALASYDPKKGSFKTYTHNLLKNRMLMHIEKEMARSGGGGVDPHFLQAVRSVKRERAKQQAEMVPKLKEEPTVPQTTPQVSPEATPTNLEEAPVTSTSPTPKLK